jgi:beta-glucosidase-like glycosyl hydrolase
VHHIKNEAEKAELLNEKARYAARHDGMPLIVSTDQEGGSVSRLRLLNPGYKFLSPLEMQPMADDAIYRHGQEVGRRILSSGVNMLLAPSLDVADLNTLMAKQGRSFGTTPEQVIRKAGPWINGIRSTFPELIIIAKHYPGYNFRGNSDNQPITSQEDAAAVRRRAAPFLTMGNLSGVMMNSVLYKSFNGDVAAFSRELIDMYRATNPDGIVMTDDIVAPSLVNAGLKGAERNAAIAEVAFKAFSAGCDIILAMDGAAMPAVANLISQRVDADSSGALRTRLLRSYERVNKARRALMGRTGGSAPPPQPPQPRVNPDQPPACLGAEFFKKAQTILVSKGTLPAGSNDGKWGPRSQAGLNAWLSRNSLPTVTCLTPASLNALEATA